MTLTDNLKNVADHNVSVVNEEATLVPYSKDGKVRVQKSKRAADSATYFESYLFETGTDCTGAEQDQKFQNVNQCYQWSRSYASVAFRAASGSNNVFAWPHHNCEGDGAVARAVTAGTSRCIDRKTFSYIVYAAS